MTEHTAFQKGTHHAENHPLVSMILLLAMVFAGAILFGVLSVFIGVVASGGLESMGDLLSGSPSNVGFLKIVQAGSSIGMFVIPPLLMGLVDKPRQRYLDFRAPSTPMLWLLAIGIMFFSAPVFELAIQLNERMQLPEALSKLENWMRAKETEMERLTKLLLSDNTYWGLITSLIVVAVIPAIGEEFLLRGCVQNILIRWLKNPHVGIWITAVVFSAIHLQFYGFLPRMLLGALFGYLLFWGKSIWLPVLGHFLNNAAATLSAFHLQRQGKSLDEMEFGSQIPAYLYFISFALTVVLLYQYRNSARSGKQTVNGRTLD